MTYLAKRQNVINMFPEVLNMNEYDMVILVQKQFKHRENQQSLLDKAGLDAAFRLLTEENEEMYEAILSKSFDQFRDAIGDQFTIIYFLLFAVEGIGYLRSPKQLDQRPKNYLTYAHNVKIQHDLLVEAFATKNAVTIQNACETFIDTLATFPEESKINYQVDLLEISIGSLSKVCTTEEIANRTLASYQEQGYSVHIEKSTHGWVVFVSNDCTINGKLIPKGKFLKSVEWMSPNLVEISDETLWSKNMDMWDKYLPDVKAYISNGDTLDVETNLDTWDTDTPENYIDAETWKAMVDIQKSVK